MLWSEVHLEQQLDSVLGGRQVRQEAHQQGVCGLIQPLLMGRRKGDPGPSDHQQGVGGLIQPLLMGKRKGD